MTDRLIFVHDKRRDAYVDKTSEIVGLRPAGAYVYVDYGAARVFRYRKEHVVCYPLLATRRQVRIYKDGTLQEPYDTLFDYGKYVRLGAGEGLRSPAIEKSRIEAVDAQPLAADKERLLSYFAEVLAVKASLESETDTEAAEEVPEGEKKSSIAALLAETMQRIDPQDPRTALYAYLNGRTAACDVDNAALVYPFGCNASQKLAVQRALGNRVSVIEGPPGTGKTQTILNIVANLLMQGKTVGVVSNNNAAVDNVRDKLSKYEYGALMAELGNRTRRQAFFADKQQDFMPDPTWRLPAEERTALRTRLGELSAAIDELFRVNAELADLRTKRSYAQCEYRHLLWEQPLDEARMRRVDRCFFRPIDSRRALSFRHLVTERWQGGRPSLALRAGLLFRCGAWPGKRLFADAELLPAYADRKFYETYIAELSARIARLGAPSDKQRAKSLIEAYGKVSEALFRDMLYRKYERLNEARQEERPPFTMQNYRTHFRAFVERYPVVLSTTHSLCASIGAGHLLDYVIIDESSQVDILTAAVCCACCRNIVIIGDSRQLPHIVEEQLRAKAEELRDKHRVPDAYDYVRQNILSSFKRVFAERLPVTLLREHYRCHPLIIDFCNRKYYRNELLIMTEPKGGYPFTVLTTTASKTYSHNGRIYNQRQIDATCDWIKRQHAEPEQIGVISPYRYHAQELRRCLPPGVEADTIHKFQGREKNTIVFHTVRSEITAFLDDPNLINVAVSRAVEHLVVVKTEGMRIAHGSDIGDLLRYIRFTCDDVDSVFITSPIRSVFDVLHTEYAAMRFASDAKRESPAERIAERLIGGILAEEDRFSAIGVHRHYRLYDLVGRTVELSDEERLFVRRRSHLDFLLYNRMDNTPILGIEVDGVLHHRFDEVQVARDRRKNGILVKIGLPLLRLSTDGSSEKERIVGALEQAMQQG
ncbi:AAA domain-containing protein [Alistipes putredinis]|uniref:AAA domain-containing protein n=1 Tax=Alistipes putredinis TaxID=28117 RepID=UPI003AB322C1